MANNSPQQRPSRRATSSPLGDRLRAVREAKGIGVRELARRIGCSPGLISQIEYGRVNPSVPNLYALARQLETSVDVLLSDGTQHHSMVRIDTDLSQLEVKGDDSNTEIYRLVRVGERVAKLRRGVSWDILASRADQPTEFRQITYSPGAASSPPGEFLRHDGVEYGFVIQGSLTIEIENETLVLEPGTSICFNGERRHRLVNSGQETVRAIWLVHRASQDGFVVETNSSRAIPIDPSSARPGTQRRTRKLIEPDRS